jgi:polysaccharide export outer membrane protein
MSIARHIVIALSVSCLAGVVAACVSTAGSSIPVELYKEVPEASTNEYVIGPGDMLSIQVWDQAQMSGRMRVRSDGRVSLPLINDQDASGKTPAKLAADLEAALKSIVVNPKVTVVVEESRPLTVSVMGEVAKPGPLPFERNTGVAQALAAAGGLTNFAHKDRIFVVRTSPKPVRIRFTYEALTQSVGVASTFRLKPGDVVIVE